MILIADSLEKRAWWPRCTEGPRPPPGHRCGGVHGRVLKRFCSLRRCAGPTGQSAFTSGGWEPVHVWIHPKGRGSADMLMLFNWLSLISYYTPIPDSLYSLLLLFLLFFLVFPFPSLSWCTRLQTQNPSLWLVFRDV